MITLSRLLVHPVKSMRGFQISHAQVLESGLAFDRAFMLTESDGTFITARQFPEMVRFMPAPVPDGVVIQAPDASRALIRFADFTAESTPVEVWNNHFTAPVAPDEINQWLSSFFPREVQLRWTGREPIRRVKRFDQVPPGFADGYPFLLINEGSLRDLRQRCPASIRLEQFRPNLVVTGAPAWDEDSWSTLRIGDITFDVAKPCSRCIFTTISPEMGHKHPQGQPLATLQQFRSAQDNPADIDFGLNLLARESGILRAGDEITVTGRKAPRLYGAGQTDDSLPMAAQPRSEVSITWRGQQFSGNNQDILLEQLEMQGFRIPYSCRAGICGSCRMRLIKGEVKALKQSAVRQDGTLLSCSCIPAGDVELA